MEEFSTTGVLFLGLQFFDTHGNRYYGFAEFDPWAFDGFAFDNLPNTLITTFDLNASVPEPSALRYFATKKVPAIGLHRSRTGRAPVLGRGIGDPRRERDRDGKNKFGTKPAYRHGVPLSFPPG